MLKIGILTYHRSVNYGAFLQSYALQKYVQKLMGTSAQVELIDYHSKRAYESYISAFGGNNSWNWQKFYQYVQFQRCVNVLPKSKNKLVTDDLKEVQNFLNKEKYDLIIVGSDEIWKADGMRGFPTAYWLNFDLGATIKVSYAASSRNRIENLKEVQKEYMQEALQKFSYIGVRDKMTGCLVENLLQSKKACLNCDPTFLYSFGYNKEEYRKIFYRKHHIKNDKKLLGIMIPDEQLCKDLKQKYSDRYVIVSLLDALPSADYSLLGLTPFEWVKTIGILDMLVTNRFHGTVFAIKNNVSFLSVDDYDEIDDSKIYDLLKRCNLTKHYLPYQKTKTAKKRVEVVNRVDEILQQSECASFKEAVKEEKQRAKSFAEYMNQVGGKKVE